MDKKFLNILIAVSIIAVLAVAAAGYFSYKTGYSKGYDKGYDTGKNDTESAYKELIDKGGTSIANPLENLPSANPFTEVKSNPFSDIITNPFK